MTRKISTPVIHVACWCIFVLMWDRIMYFYISNLLNRVYFTALDVSLVAAAFYLFYLVIIPWYLRKKNFWGLMLTSSGVLVAVAVFFTWLMWLLLTKNAVPVRFSFVWNYKDLQNNRIFIALIGVMTGTAIKLAINGVRAGRQIEQLEKAKSQAELAALKAQINPHFLFNTLNNLYAQLEPENPDAKATLTMLSDLLRYQLYESDVDKVSLSREVAYSRNYFRIQALRKDNCRCEFTTEEISSPYEVVPLMFLPFLENAFKHVSDYDDQENFITSSIKFIKPDTLLFECCNTFVERLQDSPVDSGIGLPNVSKRLQLTHPDRHRLQIDQQNGVFKVLLTLKLAGC